MKINNSTIFIILLLYSNNLHMSCQRCLRTISLSPTTTIETDYTHQGSNPTTPETDSSIATPRSSQISDISDNQDAQYNDGHPLEINFDDDITVITQATLLQLNQSSATQQTHTYLITQALANQTAQHNNIITPEQTQESQEYTSKR